MIITDNNDVFSLDFFCVVKLNQHFHQAHLVVLEMKRRRYCIDFYQQFLATKGETENKIFNFFRQVGIIIRILH
jgi:hypothetical protein